MEKGLNSDFVKIAILALLFLTVVIYFLIDFLNGSTPAYSILSSETTRLSEGVLLSEYDVDSHASFYPSGDDGYFNVTKDGVKYYAANGLEQSANSFNMSSPIVVSENNVVGIFEHKGYWLYVVSNEGEIYSKQLEFPILNIAINSMGYCAVITQDKDVYNLFLYNEKGVPVTTGRIQNANVFPVAMDISNDGKVWAISCVDINGVEINSNVIYVSPLAEDLLDFKDAIIGSNLDNSDEIISLIKFMDNNKIITVSDKKISCIDAQDSFKRIWSVDLNNKLDHISFDGYKGFSVALGEGIINKPSEKIGTVKYYDLDCNIVWEYKADNKITFLDSGLGSAIIGVGRNFFAVNNKGSCIWVYSPMTDIKQMFFFQNTNNIIQVSNNKANIYTLEKLKPPASEASSAEPPEPDIHNQDLKEPDITIDTAGQTEE